MKTLDKRIIGLEDKLKKIMKVAEHSSLNGMNYGSYYPIRNRNSDQTYPQLRIETGSDKHPYKRDSKTYRTTS